MKFPHHKSIALMAKQYGCSLRTLRFYEEKGLLAPLRIGRNRYFTEMDELKLQCVIRGKKLGFSLQEIQALVSRQSNEMYSANEQHVAKLHLSPQMIIDQIESLETRRDKIIAALSDLKRVQDSRKELPELVNLE